MSASRVYPTIVTLFIFGLLISVFFLPIGYTYSETCPNCEGRGTATCETCQGSGICWVCDGTGEIWYMPESSNWCAFCHGSGNCYTCGGEGSYTCGKCGGTGTQTHWMYTPTGSTIALSIINVLLFNGLSALGYVVSALYLSFNEWVYQVDDMGFWFNPSFMTWLFAKHPKRWVKWQTAINSMSAIYLGAILFGIASLKQITSESFEVGILFSITVVGLFSLLFYKSYTSRLEASS